MVLATSVATGIGANSVGASDIRLIAVSIGYNMGEDNVFGLEVGNTSYTVTKTSVFVEQSGASTARTEMRPDDNSVVPGKLASPDPIGGSFETTETSYIGRENSVWGTAFFERRLLHSDNFAMRARAGAGVGVGGLVGYGRLVGEWSVGGTLSLVVGAEARAMPFRVGGGAGASASSYGTVLTALTGIHLKF